LGVRFRIDDDGPGIGAADLDRREGARDGEGAGLGLAVTRRLARSVSSEGLGSVIDFA
jgi:signal transduction histidine kinase